MMQRHSCRFFAIVLSSIAFGCSFSFLFGIKHPWCRGWRVVAWIKRHMFDLLWLKHSTQPGCLHVEMSAEHQLVQQLVQFWKLLNRHEVFGNLVIIQFLQSQSELPVQSIKNLGHPYHFLHFRHQKRNLHMLWPEVLFPSQAQAGVQEELLSFLQEIRSISLMVLAAHQHHLQVPPLMKEIQKLLLVTINIPSHNSCNLLSFLVVFLWSGWWSLQNFHYFMLFLHYTWTLINCGLLWKHVWEVVSSIQVVRPLHVSTALRSLSK